MNVTPFPIAPPLKTLGYRRLGALMHLPGAYWPRFVLLGEVDPEGDPCEQALACAQARHALGHASVRGRVTIDDFRELQRRADIEAKLCEKFKKLREAKR
jgi:hypothetical protein